MEKFIFHVKVLPTVTLQHKWNLREIIFISTQEDIKSYVDKYLLSDKVSYPVRVKVSHNELRPLRYSDLEIIELGKANPDVKHFGLLLSH